METSSSSTPSTSSSSAPTTSSSSPAMDGAVKNQLNKLIELLIDSTRVLRKEYKNVELPNKFDRMIAICYMDKFDAKKIVFAHFDKFQAEYKYEQLALYYTINVIDDMIQEIEELLS